jgi:hypothetical protein
MTVKELIESLSKIEDQEAIVMTKGYERGFDDIKNLNLELIDMALNVNDEWYYGAHEIAEDRYHLDKFQVVKAIIL